MPPHLARSWLVRLGRYELEALLCLLGLAGGLWAFLELADLALAGEPADLDQRLLLAMRNPTDPHDPLGPGWLEEAARDVTALGSASVLILITLATLGYLLLSRRYRTAAFTLLAIVGGWVLNHLLKIGFARPRPDLVPHASAVFTASFPSGHSMMAAITYLTLAALLCRVVSRLRLKAYLLLVAATLTVLVGVSRIYLGVHWPSDVLAGWTAGAAWASCCWLLARSLQRRGRLDTEPPARNGDPV